MLGLLGLTSIGLGGTRDSCRWRRVTWAVCGALFALAVLGIFSSGFVVLLSLVLLGSAGLLAAARGGQRARTNLGIFVASAGTNFTTLLAVIGLGRAGH